MAPQYPPVISPYFAQEEEFPNYARGAMYTRPMFSPYLVPNPMIVVDGRGLQGLGSLLSGNGWIIWARYAAGGGAGYLVGKHFKHPIIGIGAGLLGLLWLDLRRGS